MKSTLNILATIWLQYYLAFRNYATSFLIYHGLTPIIYMSAFILFAEPLYTNNLNISTNLFILTSFFCYAATIGALTNVSYGLYFDIEPHGKLLAIRATPTKLWELLFGRILWSCSRTLLTAIITLSIGLLLTGIKIPLSTLLINLLFLFVINLTMASMTLLFVAYVIYDREACDCSKVLEVAMIAFSGIFIPTHLFPHWLENLAHIFPLYHSVNITRALWTDAGLAPHLPAFFILCIVGLICFLTALHKFKQRLIT